MTAPQPAEARACRIRPTISILHTGESNSLQEGYPQYEIWRWTYGDLTVHSWGKGATVTIGSFSSIAPPGVQVFLGGEHRSDWVTTFPFNVLWEGAKLIRGHPKTKGDVAIGTMRG